LMEFWKPIKRLRQNKLYDQEFKNRDDCFEEKRSFKQGCFN